MRAGSSSVHRYRKLDANFTVVVAVVVVATVLHLNAPQSFSRAAATMIIAHDSTTGSGGGAERMIFTWNHSVMESKRVAVLTQLQVSGRAASFDEAEAHPAAIRPWVYPMTAFVYLDAEARTAAAGDSERAFWITYQPTDPRGPEARRRARLDAHSRETLRRRPGGIDHSPAWSMVTFSSRARHLAHVLANLSGGARRYQQCRMRTVLLHYLPGNGTVATATPLLYLPCPDCQGTGLSRPAAVTDDDDDARDEEERLLAEVAYAAASTRACDTCLGARELEQAHVSEILAVSARRGTPAPLLAW